MLLKYRKDIDGLRAIAVMLVVLFHAKLPISGGFVGVDVFFVISGFLIASLIQKQLLRDKFTFKGFYLHRMRRILPALLLVLSITFIFNWLMLLPIDFRLFIRSLFYSLCSYSNVFFYKQSGNYFSADADSIQLLHTWSLSVEEQFYIIIPIFLILMFKYFYNKKIFDVVMGILLLSSFGLSCYLATFNHKFAYYLLPARFFELFIGVFLAIYYAKLPVIKNNRFNDFLSIVGLLLIIIPALMITKQSIFPGFNALYVCLGSAILIYLGKIENTPIVNKILSTRLFVFIGLISYSLYLWHWVVFSSLNILGVELSLVSKILIINSLIFVSFLSWKFVEQPFRNKFKWNFKKTLICLFVLPLFATGVIKTVSKQNNTFSNYRFSGDLLKYVNSSGGRASKVRRFCHKSSGGSIPDIESCYLGVKNKNKIDAILVGDSHANSIAGFIDVMLKDANLKGLPMTYSSTMFLSDVIEEDINTIFLGETVSKESIEKTMQNYRKVLTDNNFEYVIISGFYDSYYVRKKVFDKFKSYFKKSIEQIIKLGSKPVIIHDVFEINSVPYCKILNHKFNLNKNCDSLQMENFVINNEMDAFLKGLKKQFPKIILINPKDVMCKNNSCNINMENISLYYDKHHLTYPGSKILGEKYLKIKNNPFKNNEKVIN